MPDALSSAHLRDCDPSAGAPLWRKPVTPTMFVSRSTHSRNRLMQKSHPLLLLAALFALVIPTPSAAQRPLSAAGRSVVYAPHGIVATSQPLASSAGLAVLQHGGNAIDAAVTAAAVLSVTEPMMTGIGGDMFATVWIAKEHRLVAINASGRAGALMTREALVARGRQQMQARGVETVTVPGALAGWDELLKK